MNPGLAAFASFVLLASTLAWVFWLASDRGPQRWNAVSLAVLSGILYVYVSQTLDSWSR